MASWQRIESCDVDRLVYIDKGLPRVGALLSLVGLVGTIGTGGHAIVSWLTAPLGSTSVGGYVLGMLFCLFLLALGCTMLARCEVVLDKVALEVIRTRSWLVWRRRVTTSLKGFTGVTWRHKLHDPQADSPTSIFPVYLTGRETEFELFGGTSQMEEARKLTEEVAAFLGLTAEHFDEALLARSTGTVMASSAILRGAFAAQTKLWSPMADPNRLICRKSFPTLLKLFGALAMPMGFLFLLAPSLGIHVDMGDEAGEQSQWVVLLIGSVFTGAGLLCLLGCRGFTIQKDFGTVKLWCGLLVPLLSKQHDLRPFKCVALGRHVTTTSSNYPAVRHKVALRGPHGDELTIYQSLSCDDAKTFAEQAAAFLNWEIVLGAEQ